MAVKIQLRRATLSQWTLANPVLSDGELVIETDTYQAKIGNGVTAYNSLPYAFTAGAATNQFVAFF